MLNVINCLMGVRHNLILTGLSLSKLYIKIRHIPQFFVVPEKKFKKPIKAFKNFFEVPQRTVEIKNYIKFYRDQDAKGKTYRKSFLVHFFPVCFPKLFGKIGTHDIVRKTYSQKEFFTNFL